MNVLSQLKGWVLPQSVVAAALIASSATAFAALPPFTLAPAAAALSGASFTADNLLISDCSTVTFNGQPSQMQVTYPSARRNSEA